MLELKSLATLVRCPGSTFPAGRALHSASTPMADDGDPFGKLSLGTVAVEGKMPVVLVACGSFSPITYLHLRMFGTGEGVAGTGRWATTTNSSPRVPPRNGPGCVE